MVRILEFILNEIRNNEPGVVVHVCNPSTQEAEMALGGGNQLRTGVTGWPVQSSETLTYYKKAPLSHYKQRGMIFERDSPDCCMETTWEVVNVGKSSQVAVQ
jgi:hypothetical protein